MFHASVKELESLNPSVTKEYVLLCKSCRGWKRKPALIKSVRPAGCDKSTWSGRSWAVNRYGMDCMRLRDTSRVATAGVC